MTCRHQVLSQKTVFLRIPDTGGFDDGTAGGGCAVLLNGSAGKVAQPSLIAEDGDDAFGSEDVQPLEALDSRIITRTEELIG